MKPVPKKVKPDPEGNRNLAFNKLIAEIQAKLGLCPRCGTKLRTKVTRKGSIPSAPLYDSRQEAEIVFACTKKGCAFHLVHTILYRLPEINKKFIEITIEEINQRFF